MDGVSHNNGPMNAVDVQERKLFNALPSGLRFRKPQQTHTTCMPKVAQHGHTKRDLQLRQLVLRVAFLLNAQGRFQNEFCACYLLDFKFRIYLFHVGLVHCQGLFVFRLAAESFRENLWSKNETSETVKPLGKSTQHHTNLRTSNEHDHVKSLHKHSAWVS